MKSENSIQAERKEKKMNPNLNRLTFIFTKDGFFPDPSTGGDTGRWGKLFEEDASRALYQFGLEELPKEADLTAVFLHRVSEAFLIHLRIFRSWSW